ncbi:4142_t:CDS:1, partial [Cetraspora pellucida]
AQYCRQLLQFKLDQFNTTYDTNVLAKEIDILYAINWIVKAWNNVTNETILNCWRKTEILKFSKFLELSVLPTLLSNSTITDDFNITSQNEEEKTIQNLINQLPYNNMLDANEYINIDNLNRNIDLTNEEIIDIIQ